jgi:glycosyltransferase involved in cell wall biosynthesis
VTMRIALLSTCALTTPPRRYGGTELVIAELAHGLIELGHEVVVFATADSAPAGTLVACSPRPYWPPNEIHELRHATMGWKVIASEPFDVVHVHQAAAVALNALLPTVCACTIHHVRNLDLLEHYLAFPEANYVAISRRQAELSPELEFSGVVHHGLDPAKYPLGGGRGGYCAFLARFAPEKAPHVAIQAARRAHTPIRLAGRPEALSPRPDYFIREVLPLLGDDAVWVDDLAHWPKVKFLGEARALLMPIDWDEPFGLNMIEAMLVGTPVIAFRRGSVPEVVEEGVTGYIVDSVEEMADRLQELTRFDRDGCRERARERWSYRRMTRDYLRLYASLQQPHELAAP